MDNDKETEFLDDQEDYDPKKHKQLLQSISRLGKNQYIQKPSRSEPVLKQDEFHLSKTGKLSQVKVKDTSVSVNDLVKILNKTNHLNVGKELKTTQWSKKVLPKPLEKPVADRLQRQIGFEKAKYKLKKWDPIVAKNRQSDHQVFPLDYEEIYVDTTSYARKPKPIITSIKSELQIEMEALEDKLKELKGIKKDVEDNDKEKRIQEKLTRRELISKRKELAYIRMKQSQKSAKDRLHNKIKSKKFHKLLKKEKLKEQLKQFELLQKTNPEAAMEQLEQIEKSRVLERASLRHKNTGTWAKNLQVRAKYDKDVRKDLAEQLAISRELTQKRNQDSDDNDKISETEMNEENNDEQEEDVDPFNPWVKVKRKKEANSMDEVLTGYKKYWLERNENEKAMQEYKKIIAQNNLDNGNKILSDDENTENDISKFKEILQEQEKNENKKEKQENETELELESELSDLSVSDEEDLKQNVSKIEEESNIKINKEENNNSTKKGELELESELSDLTISDDEDLKENVSKIKEQTNIKIEKKKQINLNKKEEPKILKRKNKEKFNTELKSSNCNDFQKKRPIIIENGWVVEEIHHNVLLNQHDTNLINGKKIPKQPMKIKSTTKDATTKSILMSKNLDDIFDVAEDNVHQMVSKKIKVMKNALDEIGKNSNKFKNNKTNKMEKDELQNLKDLTFKNEKKRPEFDEELYETPANVAIKDNTQNLLSNLSNQNSKNAEEKSKDETGDQIDPNNFANIKPKRLHTLINSNNPDSLLINDVGDENEIDLELSRQMTIAEAFEDDDVVVDFAKEKEDKNKQENEIDLTMPGWGSWAGCGLKPRTKKRLVLKFPEKEKRRDENKVNLFINENTSKELKEHLVSDLPFPFTSVKDYEGSIRAPIGRTFVPETAFRVLTRPAIQTKMGHIIEPMNESVLVKKPFVRKHKVDIEVEKMFKKEKAKKMKK